MYNISMRRRATKDLDGLPSNYQKLVGQHINALKESYR
jgi:mRNA-degrading endonuclease RelE of RelBE toxin-antitoxin system